MNKLCGCGCGKEVTRESNRFIKGHSNKNKREIYLKRSQNYKQQTGFENPMQNPKIQEKYRLSCNEKYNYNYPMQSKQVQEKYIQTIIKNYGVKNPMQSKQVQEKYIQTCLKKYGGHSPYCSTTVREKGRLTLNQNYNVFIPYQSKQVQEKGKQTTLKHFGVDKWAKSSQGRKYHRITSIKYIEIQKLNGEHLYPRIGNNERKFLDELQKYTNYNIIRNDPSFRYVIGRFPDGHIPELKLFIQYDERQHFVDKECKIYKQNDIDCTLQLASVGHLVFRVSEYKWMNNKNQIIKEFQTLLNLKEDILCLI